MWQLAAAGAAGCGFLYLLFVVTVHIPLQRAADGYRREAEQARSEINDVVNFHNAHLDQKSFRKEMDERKERVFRALPETMGQASFLLELERLARQSQLQLKQIKPGALVQHEGWQSLTIHIRVQGSYFALLKFMRELQAGERLASVRELGVKVENDQLSTDLALNIYAVPEK